MRTIQPGKDQVQWSKECPCTGAGNGGNGCGALLEVGWDDLYLTCHGGDPRDRIRASQAPQTPQELLAGIHQAFQRGFDPGPSGGPVFFVTFCCHNCGVETDLLQTTYQEVSMVFHLLPTKRERLQTLERFRKV